VDVPRPSDPTQTVHINTPDVAWGDLWFYSNPIFISVQVGKQLRLVRGGRVAKDPPAPFRVLSVYGES